MLRPLDRPQHHKLRRGPTARRQAAATRQKFYRQRQRDRSRVVFVEVSEENVELLIELGYLIEKDAVDRRAIARAIERMLANVEK